MMLKECSDVKKELDKAIVEVDKKADLGDETSDTETQLLTSTMLA